MGSGLRAWTLDSRPLQVRASANKLCCFSLELNQERGGRVLSSARPC
jgi:hypothetical protein